MGLSSDTMLLGIAVLIVWVGTLLPTNPESGLVGVLGGVIVLLGYLGSTYSRMADSD
jgi:Flp pilus assembly protein TadB